MPRTAAVLRQQVSTTWLDDKILTVAVIARVAMKITNAIVDAIAAILITSN